MRIGYIGNIIDVMLLNNNFNLRYIIVDFIWIIGLEFDFQVELWLCVHIWFVGLDDRVGTYLGKNHQSPLQENLVPTKVWARANSCKLLSSLLLGGGEDPGCH